MTKRNKVKKIFAFSSNLYPFYVPPSYQDKKVKTSSLMFSKKKRYLFLVGKRYKILKCQNISNKKHKNLLT